MSLTIVPEGTITVETVQLTDVGEVLVTPSRLTDFPSIRHLLPVPWQSSPVVGYVPNPENIWGPGAWVLAVSGGVN